MIRASLAVLVGYLYGISGFLFFTPTLDQITDWLIYLISGSTPHDTYSIALVGAAVFFVPPIVFSLGTHGLLTWLCRPTSNDTETRCRKCNYILRGLTEPRCPECGEKI